jgi:hypothetical protein
MFQCYTCWVEKPTTEFYKSKAKRWHNRDCTLCYRGKNRIRSKNRKARAIHEEEIQNTHEMTTRDKFVLLLNKRF